MVKTVDRDGNTHEGRLRDLRVTAVRDLVPFRVMRWHHGQTNFPGTYWSSTMHAHVPYESRLELSRLLLADFDPTVRFILAQPFQILGRDTRGPRRHVPDFCLLNHQGAVRIVNVKPVDRLGVPKVADALRWAGDTFEDRGWAHEVWTGTDPVVMSNIRFLAGYRRDALHDVDLVDAVTAAGPGRTIGATIEGLSGWDPVRVGPAVLHCVWTHRLGTDLTVPLGKATLLEARS